MMRTAVALGVLGLLACKSKQDAPPAPAPTPADAGAVAPPVTDWAGCEMTLRALPKAPPMRRVQTLLAACRPCGDWGPLLAWNSDTAKPLDILAAMEACDGFCSKDAKQKFMGTLDKKGPSSRGPWKYLGEACQAAVSAVPDNRYASAPWFALDRIARAAAARPELAPLLDKIELPLPAVSVSGFGYDLARSPVTAPDVGPLALTITPKEIRVAALAHARLGKDGVTTVTHGESYPGVLVTSAKDFDAAVAKLAPAIAADAPISVFAPRGMPASRLLAVFPITGPRPGPGPTGPATTGWLGGDIRLAVAADHGPPGWSVAGSIPISLRVDAPATAVRIELTGDPDPAIAELKTRKLDLAKAGLQVPTGPASKDVRQPPPSAPVPALAVAIGPEVTVEQLAKLLGAAVYFDVKAVALISTKNSNKGATGRASP